MKKLFTILLLVMASLTTRTQVPDFDFREVEYGPYQTTVHLFAPAEAKKVVVRI